MVNDASNLVDSVGNDAHPFWAHRLIKGGYNTEYCQDNLHITTTKTVVASSYTNLSTNSNFNPFGVSDRIINSSPNDNSWTEAICIKSGYTCSQAWAPNTAVPVDNFRFSNGNVYQSIVGGQTSEVSPNHTTGSAVDGTVTWKYIGSLAVFKELGKKGAHVPNEDYTLSATPTAQELSNALSKIQLELRKLKTSVSQAGVISNV